MSDELKQQIRALVSPGGHEADLRDRDRALAFLLVHADEAHPRLLALLDPQAGFIPVAVVNAMPLFGRPESVPVLEKIMREGAELISMSAGQALARHPRPESLAALMRGLEANRDETKVAALDGLMTRGDKTVCPAVQQLLDHASYEVRYHAVNVAAHLGCLSSENLRHIAESDSEQDIRELASSLMSGNQ
jgi:HEAT repeat protein